MPTYLEYLLKKVEYGGLCETDVECILGGKTKSKTDMWLHLSDGRRLNVSIKKDVGGQVFLIGIDRFISGFERQYKKIFQMIFAEQFLYILVRHQIL